jgi:oxygen-independent coproporphyrinogen-3 oxidase
MRGWRMSEDDVRRKWLIQRLMCQGEVNSKRYAKAFDEALEERIPDLEARLAPFEADGLLIPDDGSYRVSQLGRLFLRVIAMSFDAYLPEETPEKPMFSRTL